MKKNILSASAGTLLALNAHATSLKTSMKCRNTSNAPSQGYEAVVNAKYASILLNGERVAILSMKKFEPATTPDSFSVTTYFTKTVNGYGLKIENGGFTGRTFATVYRGGVAGYQPVEQLNMCQ